MPETSEPLYLQLASTLRERIEQGIYPAAAALPTEAAMSREHGHARMTVRRALAVLREEGRITTKRGAPSVVRPRTERKPVVLQQNERLVSRMPSHLERIRLGLDPGVPLLEVRRTDGSVELFAADRVEVLGH